MGVVDAVLQSHWLQAGASYVLASLRVAAVLALTPLLSAFPMPAFVRACVVLGLAVSISMGVQTQGGAGAPENIGQWLQAAFVEVGLGLILGLGVQLAFAAFAVGGSLLDAQIGFGIAQILDPGTRRPVSLLSTAMTYLGCVVFLLSGGLHAMLRGFAYSLEVFPVGQPWEIQRAMEPMLLQIAALFSLGFALAAPVVFCILLVELALGVITRSLPQMNMLALGFPAKILVGLIALCWLFQSGIGGVVSRIYASIFSTWAALFSRAMEGAR